MFYAAYLEKNRDKLKNIFHGFFIPFMYLVPAVLILVLFQEHFSATLIIVAVTSIMMIVAGSKLSHFLTVGLAGGIMGVIFLFTKGAGFRMDRIQAWLDPWADPTGDAWQSIQSLYAIGSGGLFGAGLRTKQAKIFIHTRTTQGLYFRNISRRIRLYRLCSSNITFRNIYMERSNNCNESTRYVWKPISSWNYCFDRITGNYKYCGCNGKYTSNRYATSIF